MNRREMMQALALAAAATAVSCSGPAEEQGDTASELVEKRGFLSADELTLFSALAQTIIPETDTPGAIGAGIVERVDIALDLWQNDEVKTLWQEGLALLRTLLVNGAGTPFVDLDEAARQSLLEPLDLGSEDSPEAARSFFAQLKPFVCLAYYRSEPGATEELYYESVPGEYRGCVPFEEIGRAYAFDDL